MDCCVCTSWWFWFVLLVSMAALAVSSWVNGYVTANRKNYEAILRLSSSLERKQRERRPHQRAG